MSEFPASSSDALNDVGESDDARQSVTCISPSAATDFDIKIVVIGDKGVGKVSDM
jgi:GTPase SAR1 family protein